jgi:Ran-binding protein 1
LDALSRFIAVIFIPFFYIFTFDTCTYSLFYFLPPILQIIATSTITKQETLVGLRSKLFIYGETLLDKGTGKKSWRERGIGEAKILRHKEHQRLRILMRQEKTMKVIANHALDPRIKLEPNAGSDRSWVWSAFDFATGELVETVFALRFADSEIADSFKEKFEEGQKEMEALLAGEDKPDEDGAADEVADALSGLKTSDDDAADAPADDDKKEE